MIHVWSADGSGEPLVLRGHTASVNAVVWSPDGRRLFSGSDDGTVRIWSSDGSGESTVLSGHTGAVYGIDISPDGRWLVSTSSDKTIRVWRDLERVTIDDPVLWTSTNCCLSIELRQQLLSVSEPVARALNARCLARTGALALAHQVDVQ